MTTIDTPAPATFASALRAGRHSDELVVGDDGRSTTPVVVGLCVYGVVLLGIGIVLCGAGMGGFGVLSVGEGLFRIATAVGVRARRQGWVVAGLVHCGLALVAASLSLPLGIVGVLANCALVRGLHDLKD
jgi:hypothetical protein